MSKDLDSTGSLYKTACRIYYIGIINITVGVWFEYGHILDRLFNLNHNTLIIIVYLSVCLTSLEVYRIKRIEAIEVTKNP